MTTQAYRDNFAEIEWRPFTTPPLPAPVPPARSDFPAPRIVRDEMPPIRSMATGKIHTSRSGYYREIKDHDCVIMADEKRPPKAKQAPDRKAIKDAVQRAEARFNRGERVR